MRLLEPCVLDPARTDDDVLVSALDLLFGEGRPELGSSFKCNWHLELKRQFADSSHALLISVLNTLLDADDEEDEPRPEEDEDLPLFPPDIGLTRMSSITRTSSSPVAVVRYIGGDISDAISMFSIDESGDDDNLLREPKLLLRPELLPQY